MKSTISFILATLLALALVPIARSADCPAVARIGIFDVTLTYTGMGTSVRWVVICPAGMPDSGVVAVGEGSPFSFPRPPDGWYVAHVAASDTCILPFLVGTSDVEPISWGALRARFERN